MEGTSIAVLTGQENTGMHKYHIGQVLRITTGTHAGKTFEAYAIERDNFELTDEEVIRRTKSGKKDSSMQDQPLYYSAGLGLWFYEEEVEPGEEEHS
jgi:hypothetical protein